VFDVGSILTVSLGVNFIIFLHRESSRVNLIIIHSSSDAACQFRHEIYRHSPYGLCTLLYSSCLNHTGIAAVFLTILFVSVST